MFLCDTTFISYIGTKLYGVNLHCDCLGFQYLKSFNIKVKSFSDSKERVSKELINETCTNNFDENRNHLFNCSYQSHSWQSQLLYLFCSFIYFTDTVVFITYLASVFIFIQLVIRLIFWINSLFVDFLLYILYFITVISLYSFLDLYCYHLLTNGI